MARKPESPKRPSLVTVPKHGHPFAKLVFGEMKRQGVTYDQLEWDSGVLRGTFKRWRVDSNPGLITIEATLGALGWALIPVPRQDMLPPALQAQLDAMAAEWQRETPLLHELLATVCRAPLLAAVRPASAEVIALPKPKKRREPHPGQAELVLEIAA